VAAVADELLAGQAGPRLATDTLFPPGSGHPTPKVDVRAVVVRDGRVLLVRERTDGGWAMPGGWADPGLSPAQIAVKETAEEAGLEVRATRLLALWDRDAQGMEPYAHAVYKAYLACEPLDAGAEPVAGPEALDAGWFAPAALPALSLTRNTPEQVRRLVALAADPAAPALFD
jgi:ADP-ribose pyrophosphatase YjhB (NUDIX family)